MKQIYRRDRQTGRQIETERQKEVDKQTNKQTNRQTETQLETGGDKHADKVKRREIIRKKIVESYLRANPKTRLHVQTGRQNSFSFCANRSFFLLLGVH